MKTAILLRIASLLTLVFFAGHTSAFVVQLRGPEEAAVFMAMQSYKFKLLWALRTHWDLYRGYGLLFSVTLLLLAVLLWQLSATARVSPSAARPMVASLLVAYLAFTVVGGLYFFVAPAVISAAVAICLSLALASTKRG